MFFSFDGVDGAGKTTQVSLFVDWLRAQGYDVAPCRDPGSTPLGERIRGILLEPKQPMPIAARSEMLLYMAARAQLVDELISPALANGKTVVSDRFLLANVVYQGYAGGLNVEALWTVGRLATRGVEPDCIFLLDMAPAHARRRIDRDLDRMESQDTEYRSRLRDGFLAEAKRRPQQIVVMDADQPIDRVHADIRAAAERFLGDMK